MADLARLADVGFSTARAWKAGRRTPQVDLLAGVMEFFCKPQSKTLSLSLLRNATREIGVLSAGSRKPQLAAAAGIATTTLREIERADVGLTNNDAATLVELLKISVETYCAAYQRARRRPPGTPA